MLWEKDKYLNNKEKIQMVDLVGQYDRLKSEIDVEMSEVLQSARYINGPAVKEFEKSFASYLGVRFVIPCANGTDALQVALMALGLKQGDEVIVPAFTYVATAEVIGLLGLTPVMVDVDVDSFNTNAGLIEAAITPKTKAIVPVHLFGQCSDMEEIMILAKRHDLFVVEDTAQAIGSKYTNSLGEVVSAGCIGDIGTTSFFPSKNLGCFGDGGAIFTNDEQLAKKCRMIASHGQAKKYHHAVLGCNSRLDSLQAAVLNVKLRHLDSFTASRREAAKVYDEGLRDIVELNIPYRSSSSTHVFHQYTITVRKGKRDSLKNHLDHFGIPSMIYYPLPLYDQEAFRSYHEGLRLRNSDKLCQEVLSLPMHTEMKKSTQGYIIECVRSFFSKSYL